MLREIVPQTKERFAVGETCFLLEGAAGEQTADGDDVDMVMISFVSLFGNVCERALSERCVSVTYYVSYFSHDSDILGPTMLIC
jgi:hypothetical protein